MSFPRCETQAIGHVFDGCRGESIVDDKNFNDLLDGKGIGSLSLDKQSKSEQGASLKELQLQEMLAIFGFVPAYVASTPPPEFDGGPGPCLICSGPHTRAVCALQFRCSLDQEVGDTYKVICNCGSDVVKGMCATKGCSYNYGCAVTKKQWFEV